jgi:DMSO reductase anchor subunit
MHPAFSVIFFTVGSGTGYGLMAMFGTLGAFGLLPNDPIFGLIGMGVALSFVTTGLLSSTWHLGHPERAIGAFSQWRTSWLSREGVISVFTYAPALLMAYLWYVQTMQSSLFIAVSALTAIGAAITVFCTAMIYRSLATIHQWHNQWTVPGYLVMGLAGGCVVLLATMRVFSIETQTLPYCVTASLVLAWGVKTLYWRFIDTTAHQSNPETATGLGVIGKVTKLEGPHTEANYLLNEMGFQVARKHAVKLRRYAHLLGFVLPIVLTLVSMVVSGGVATIMVLIASLSFLVGAVVERWLFFAEAKHTVMLYYGAERV